MIRPFIWAFGLFFLLLSCGQNETSASGDPQSETIQESSSAYWSRPRKLPLSEEAGRIANGWGSFMEFERSYDLLTRANSEEEMKLAVNDLLEKEEKLAKEGYPEAFDRTSVRSRQKVVKTMLLKLKWELRNRDSITRTVDELSGSYNAMRAQMNQILRNKLDTLQLIER
jgi:hypothetical protein